MKDEYMDAKNYTIHEAQASVAQLMHGAGQIVRDLPEYQLPTMEILRCHKVLDEEVKELFIAMDDGDLVEVVDGLGDILYVVLSIANTYGISLCSAVKEICDNNLKKIVEPRRFSPEGKLLKPPGHEPPDILSCILAQVPGDADTKIKFADTMLAFTRAVSAKKFVGPTITLE